MQVKEIAQVTRVDKERFGETYYIGDDFIVEVSTINRFSDGKQAFITLSTYFRDSNGNWWGYFNPQSKMTKDRKRTEWRMENVLPYTPENVECLVAKCIRLYNKGKGSKKYA